MQSMFDTVETENQLSFAEKLHFRVLNSEYSIENRAILVIQYAHANRQETRQMKRSNQVRIQHKNLTIRQAEVTDAKQLAAWWNDGAVMAHAGFPNGLGTTEEEVVKGLRNGLLVVEESDRLIGECNYHNASDGVAEIGIKICETDCQNRGVGRKVLSMLISWLFRNGYAKIILDTNLTNTRAQHVYELLGFRKIRTNIDSWKDQFGRLQSSVDYALVEQDFVSYE